MISKSLLKLLKEDGPDNDLGLVSLLADAGISEEVQVDDVTVDDEGDAVVTFVNDDDELVVVFTVDEEIPMAVIIEDDDEEDEVEYFDLSDLNPPMKDGKIDFSIPMSDWLDVDTLLDILDGEDEFEDEETVSETSVYVVRGGQRVKKPLVRRKRKKLLTSARKFAIRKAVRSRRRTQAQANRKRKRSLQIRKRAKLKTNRNSRMKVAGTASHL